ncbi:sugar transferase [Cyanobium sp. FGCU-52]|nr:sugar transferase [Cyanobium sp. FGCU52]
MTAHRPRSPVLWLRPRQVLLLCAGLDLLGVAGLAFLVDRVFRTDLLLHPEWLLPFGLTYIGFSWLFGSYTLLRWPRLDPGQLFVRLMVTALATALMVVLAYWVLNLPPTFTLGHRRIQLLLLSGLSLWALGVRLQLRRLGRSGQAGGLSVLELAERQQQRLLPAHLPEEALVPDDLPWNDPLSVQRQLKRSADITLALLLLMATLPLMLLAGLLIWLEDRGPVFFVQERSGLLGSTFRLYKLRTMRQADPDAPATWTVRGDSRITRIGFLLRRVRLDELPQLINVLRGDMSLIGPRPERPELEHELEERIPHYRKRHWMPPGLSGWAQVCAPYAASVQEAELKLSYDLYYLRHWGTALDLLILLKTLKTVLKARGR